LSTRGIEPRVWGLSAGDAATVEREVCQWRPDLVHAFHAFHAGPLSARVARLLGLPLVVTLTGTDANHDLADAQRGPTVREVLEGAAAITVFHRSIGARVSAARPERAGPGVAISEQCRTPACPPSSARPTSCSTARSPKEACRTRCSRHSRSDARCSPPTSRATAR